MIVCAEPVIWAGDTSDGDLSVKPAAMAAVTATGALPHEVAITPFIHPSMAPHIRAKLEAGLELAVERLREVQTCRDLFTRLGADWPEMLNTSLYLQVDSYRREVQVCGRTAAANPWGAKKRILAFTSAGAPSTWLCRNFAWVSAETAAVVVIHEALHHAGLTEWPVDRTAMTSVEINRMVRKACEF
jgi:hypothetical protein